MDIRVCDRSKLTSEPYINNDILEWSKGKSPSKKHHNNRKSSVKRNRPVPAGPGGEST